MQFIVFAPDPCNEHEIMVFPANEFHITQGFIHFPDVDRHYSLDYFEMSLVGNICYVDVL